MLNMTTSLLVCFRRNQVRAPSPSNRNSCQHCNNCALFVNRAKQACCARHVTTDKHVYKVWDKGTVRHNFTLQAQDVRLCLDPSALAYRANSVLRNDGKHLSNYTVPHSKTLDILSCTAVRTANSYSAVLLHPQIGSTNRHLYEVCPNYE
jgi:hypothetical protein